MKNCCALFAVCLALASCFAVFAGSTANAAEEDPYLEYERIDSPEAIAWIEKQNAKTLDRLTGDPHYQDFYKNELDYRNSDDRIVYPSFYRGSDIVRNFWRDKAHPQGVVRQTTVERFFSQDYQWETVLDINALSVAEGVTWVFSGTTYPFRNPARGIVALSDGGKDATELREYDFVRREFVKDGFFIEESKSGVQWLDEGTLLVASALTEEEQTNSGYPRVIKRWERGTSLAEAPVLYSVGKDDIRVATGWVELEEDVQTVLFFRIIDFYNAEYYLYDHDGRGGLAKINIPTDANVGEYYKGNWIIHLKSDWVTGGAVFKQGSVVYLPFADAFLDDPKPTLLLEPTEQMAISGVDSTREYLYVTTTENVQSKLYQYRLDDSGWTRKPLPVQPLNMAEIMRAPLDKGFVLYVESGFLEPTRLFRVEEKSLEKSLVQSLPEKFDPAPYVVKQEFAVSADQTRIPYFLVHRKDLVYDGRNPVVQYGYGGFLNSMLPYYIPIQEHNWLRDGGVYVMANIRGGGEYGPSWHEQARQEKRHKAFEDFIAVAEDLVAKKITSPRHLGMEGGSNGGLLTGAVMVMRPDLFNAAVIAVPLLDMLRYHLLPPGASWVGEYGDPDDPEMRKAIQAYSPYQNLKKGVTYPAPFLMTSSKDDRVHPGHARKFAKRLEEYGQDFYYYEELEGGHGGRANFEQSARSNALQWIYMRKRLME